MMTARTDVLVQVDVCRLTVDLVGNGEIGLIVEDERRGLSGGGGRSFPLSELFVLFLNLVVH